ncbi:hypothetical protein PRIPAC_71954, partial [Pristionchus pacificus]|uniref:Uncharacterized protein n=1 Tax=Pristionchus pacificus TaxID=54126 RepID=A0A2A6D0I2_PRIPA
MSRPAVGDLDSVVQQARKLKPLTQEYNAIQEQIDCVSSLPSTTQTASLPGWREGLLGKLRVKQSDAYNERESILSSLNTTLDRLAGLTSVKGLSHTSTTDYDVFIGHFYKVVNSSRLSPSFITDPLPATVSISLDRLKSDLQIKQS